MRWDTIQCIRSTINVKNTTIKIVLEFLLWWLIMSGPYLRRWEEGDRSSRLKNDFKAETKCKTLNSKMICQLLVQMIFFFSELKVLQISLLNALTSTFEILEFIKTKYYYPNVSIGYRIPLTLSMTVTFVEKRFSKLNFLKNYRPLMSQKDWMI